MCQGQCQPPPTAACPEARASAVLLMRMREGRGPVCRGVGGGLPWSLCACPATSTLHLSMHFRSDHITRHMFTHHMAAHRCKQTYTVTCSRHTQRHTNTGSWLHTPQGHEHLSRPHTMQRHTPQHFCTHTPCRHPAQSCDGRSTSMDSCHCGHSSRERISWRVWVMVELLRLLKLILDI